jgi:hypothetical protein
VEDTVNGTVVDARHLCNGTRHWIAYGCSPPRKAALEKRESIGIEKAPASRRELERAMLHTEENGAKQCVKLAVCAEAVMHALGVSARIVRQALVETGEAEVLRVDAVVNWQQALVF